MDGPYFEMQNTLQQTYCNSFREQNNEAPNDGLEFLVSGQYLNTQEDSSSRNQPNAFHDSKFRVNS